MATVFKKSKRNFRKKNINDDGGDGEVDSPMECDEIQIPIEIPFLTDKPKTKKPPAKSKAVPPANSLLSFDDEFAADNGQEFKVKKSKESRKVAKKLDQGRKKKDKEKVPTKIEEKPKALEKVVHEDASNATDDDRLAALRAELSKMSRTDDDEEDEDLSRSTSNDNTVSSSGHMFSIPDATAIHAARKKREMARQLGTGQDFIPLDDTDRYGGRFSNDPGKSRLIREDDNDASDDEDGPISFSAAAGKKSFPAMDRRREVQNALVNEESEEKNGEDGEIQRWEEEQIRKGISVQQLPDQQQMAEFKQEEQIKASESTLFNQTPYMFGGSYISGTLGVQTNGPPATSYPALQQQAVTVDMICDKMNQRLLSLQEVHRSNKLELDKLVSRVETSETSIDSFEKQGTGAEQRFGFYQETRGYVRDLIECLNEKVPKIEECEKSMHLLLKQRADSLVQRRQSDVQDCAEGFLNVQSGKQVQIAMDEFGRDRSMFMENAKQRRATEREGRRSRRRRQREKTEQSRPHHDGLSTDDEEMESDIVKFKAESEKILMEAKKLFEDVVEDFSSVDVVKKRFEEWKLTYGDCYKQAYISLCLPKLFVPFVELQLLDWNPFEEKCQDFEEMSWYKGVVLFGIGSDPYDIDVDDTDVKLLPSLLEKTVISKLTGLFKFVWDPLSTQQTELALKLIKRLAEDYPSVHAQNKATQSLFTAVVTRVRRCVSDDVYVPLYPRSLLDNKTSGALTFFHRQFWSCVKLFGNILMWQGVISSSQLHELAIDGLLNRYLILALQHSHLYYDSLDKCKAIVACFPAQWFEGVSQTHMVSLQAFTRYLVNLASCLQRSSSGCAEAQKKKAKSGIKTVVQLLIQLKDFVKAEVVSAEHDLSS